MFKIRKTEFSLGVIVGDLCLYAFFLLSLIIFLYSYSHALFLTRLGFMIPGAIAGLIICIRNRKYSTLVYLLCIIVCYVFCTLVQSSLNYSVTDMIYTICYFGLAFVLLNNKYRHFATILIMAMGIGTVLLKIFQGISFNMILLANSRNYISALLLTVMLFYYVSCHDKTKYFLVTPAIISFLISIYATGRGGIISTGFLAGALLIIKIREIENKSLRRLLIFILIVVAIVTLVYLTGIGETKFQDFLQKNFSRFYLKGAGDTARSDIWNAFLENNKRSIVSFIFSSDTTLARSDGNLHNSFLQSYASFGLMGFMIVVIMTFRSLIIGIKERDVLLTILFTTLIIRAFTDRIFFQGYNEIFLYYFMFYWDIHRFERKTVSNRISISKIA